MERRAAALLGVVVLATLVAAGGSPEPASTASISPAESGSAAAASRLGYVGRVPGTNAFVGIVVRGDAVTAYVCDSRKLARWFQGRLRNGRALLRSGTGGRLEVDLRRAPRGVLRLPRRKALPFVVSPARGRAGLFRAERAVTTRARRTGRRLTGWVRLNDGSLRGASVTTLYRIERPEPGISVVLLAETGGTIAAPPTGPQAEERVTGANVPICRWFTGVTGDGRRSPLTIPGCGIPRAGAKPPEGSGPKLISRPRDFGLSEAALAAFAARLPGQHAAQRAALLKRAGQRDPHLPSQRARALIATQAAAMRADSRLLAGAERLRTASTPAEVLARTEAYKRLAGGYRDAVNDVLPLFSPLVAIFSHGLRPSVPARRSYRGPWADISHIVTSGDDWRFDESPVEICRDFVRCLPLLNIVADATTVRAHVRAGFDSSIEWHRGHLLTFDVPPHAGDVEVEIAGADVDIQIDVEDCFGSADGWANTGFNVYPITGGVVADEPIAAVGLEHQFGDPTQGVTPGPIPGTLVSTNDCVPSLAPPIPRPPRLNIVGEANAVLKFAAPPEGGSYALSAGVTAQAAVMLGGTSVTQVRLGVDEVIVRHR